MRVGAGEPERADAGNARAAPGNPRRRFRRDHQRQVVPVDEGVQFLQMQMRGDLLVLQRQDDLDEPCNSCGRLEMTEVGLDRADHQRPVLRPSLTKHGSQRLDLDWIAERGSGAVRLDVTDRRGRDSSGGQSVAQQLLL